jgi:hypothetical protein
MARNLKNPDQAPRTVVPIVESFDFGKTGITPSNDCCIYNQDWVGPENFGLGLYTSGSGWARDFTK